jgi:3-dehydroquinate dehydratase/shikimate dehydrogenase
MPPLKSLPPLCIALGFADAEQLVSRACKESEAGETLFEFRLDYLRQPKSGVEALRKFVASHPDCIVLATCRRRQNQGRFNGSIEEQISLLQTAAEAGAKALDLEIESAEGSLPSLARLRASGPVIVSYHNFESTPPVDSILKRLERCPADAYKIVTTSRKPSDICRLLGLLKPHPKTPLIVFSMGEIGFPSRVLSPLRGGLFSYAAPSSNEGTAPGQVDARVFRHLYRLGRLSRAAKVYGVIADPVRHSISPAVHNRAFQARRLDAVYLPFLVPSPSLKDFMTMALDLPVSGFSVTIPHKQRILRYLDAVDPVARRIGAVNTVWRKAGRWRGMNADAEAVVKPLSRQLRLAKSSVLIAGNGGAARSAAFALADTGAKVSIVGRNADRVRALCKACGAQTVLREQISGLHFDALVHATSLGMHPRVGECFFEDRIPADVVFDMVYNPADTLLIQRAREQRCTVVPGLQMFLEQAATQFEIWTGESAPRTVMERAAREALG